MSPLLTSRPSVAVVNRLLGACVVTASIAAAIALGNSGAARPSAAVPTFYAAGLLCAGVVAYLLTVTARVVEDRRLLWMAVAATVAGIGLALSLASQQSLIANRSIVSGSAGAGAMRNLLWHATIAVAAVLAVRRVRPSRPRLLAFVLIAGALLLYTLIDTEPFRALFDRGDGYNAGIKLASGALALIVAGSALAWWRADRDAPQWASACMIALLLLSAADSLAYAFADQPYLGAWWASLTLRAGQFAVPAAGLMMGFVAMTDKLRDLQREIGSNLEAELERGRREEELASADAERRETLRARVRRLAGGDGLGVAFQPIIDLDSGDVVGAEALARFSEPDGTRIPTESCFLDAHALGLGTELELSAIRLALDDQHRLPHGLYLALNVSPALLDGDALLATLMPHLHERPIVVELTEHQQVEDYASLSASLNNLRDHGIRVAIDDVGSGFSSFRHVTRVNPEILKLDRTLVCGIHDDPVRQSLAAAIVSFARDVGAVVVSEGIESERELACLRDLAVGCGQGFFLARPNLGAIESKLRELTRV
jgi:EAL domain-containing protein (putative c-di-GMP-specific phosphodiesterase class I)